MPHINATLLRLLGGAPVIRAVRGEIDALCALHHRDGRLDLVGPVEGECEGVEHLGDQRVVGSSAASRMVSAASSSPRAESHRTASHRVTPRFSRRSAVRRWLAPRSSRLRRYCRRQRGRRQVRHRRRWQGGARPSDTSKHWAAGAGTTLLECAGTRKTRARRAARPGHSAVGRSLSDTVGGPRGIEEIQCDADRGVGRE